MIFNRKIFKYNFIGNYIYFVINGNLFDEFDIGFGRVFVSCKDILVNGFRIFINKIYVDIKLYNN